MLVKDPPSQTNIALVEMYFAQRTHLYCYLVLRRGSPQGERRAGWLDLFSSCFQAHSVACHQPEVRKHCMFIHIVNKKCTELLF